MVSIHLILLFIRFGKVPVIVTQMFQYISCYSLSGSIGELSVVNRLFQYISCYSLSIKTMVSVGIRKVSIHLMLLFIGLLQSNSEPHSPFQYISCYSLSVTVNTYGAKDVRFNTSHVTLYRKTLQSPQDPFCRFQYISCYSLSWSITDNKRLKRVSIHLMLLFIEALLKISGLHIAVSIHLMLLFIFCCWFLWLHIKFVSIHLMLLFIKLHKTL